MFDIYLTSKLTYDNMSTEFRSEYGVGFIISGTWLHRLTVCMFVHAIELSHHMPAYENMNTRPSSSISYLFVQVSSCL